MTIGNKRGATEWRSYNPLLVAAYTLRVVIFIYTKSLETRSF